jgi:hypothetical protein
VSFFEPPPPPPPPPPEAFHQPEWLGPAQNILGVAVPIREVLARTADTVIVVQHFTAYPNGVHFELLIARRKPPEDHLDDPLHRFHMMRHAFRGGELPPDLLRFGVLLADGSKATTLGPSPFLGGPDKAPEGPVLIEHGGGGGHASWNMGYWLWPLPPKGPLVFVVEWPSEGIGETRVEIDGSPIRDGASRAETLWPVEESLEFPIETRHSHQVMFARDVEPEEPG